MEKQKKSTGLIALVILLLAITIVAVIIATYAWTKYTEKVAEGTSTVEVAKWDVSATIDGAAQYTKTFNHVVPTKMAPGTSGVIPVTVNLGETDVCVKYEIFLEGVQNKPTNVKFYRATKNGENYEYTAADEIQVSTAATASTASITDYLELAGANENQRNTDEIVTEYIVWDWPYDNSGVTIGTKTGDEVDTEEGDANKSMSVNVRVVATQVNPNSVPESDNV